MSERQLYVVAYDIPSNGRRTKVHKILSGFGEWTQYSLFEMFLNEKERILLISKLQPVLNPQEDSVRFYPLCAACVKRVETIGSEPPQERKLVLV
jgi:CRISPR-associated protein Cas2